MRKLSRGSVRCSTHTPSPIKWSAMLIERRDRHVRTSFFVVVGTENPTEVEEVDSDVVEVVGALVGIVKLKLSGLKPKFGGAAEEVLSFFCSPQVNSVFVVDVVSSVLSACEGAAKPKSVLVADSVPSVTEEDEPNPVKELEKEEDVKEPNAGIAVNEVPSPLDSSLRPSSSAALLVGERVTSFSFFLLFLLSLSSLSSSSVEPLLVVLSVALKEKMDSEAATPHIER